MSSPRTRAVFAAAASLMLASAAGAVTYQGAAGPLSNGGTTSAPATYTYSDLLSSATSTTSSATGGSVYATGSSISPGGVVAYAQIDYSFQIVGPTTGPYAVPVAVSASGYVDGGGYFFIAYDKFEVEFEAPLGPDNTFYRGINQTLESASFSPFPSIYQPFSYNNTILMPVNSNINVTLLANINAGAGGPDGTSNSAVAFLDPFFTLVGAPAGYNIVGVPELAGAVPEPSSWALIALGFGLTGQRLRRRRLHLEA